MWSDLVKTSLKEKPLMPPMIVSGWIIAGTALGVMSITSIAATVYVIRIVLAS